MCASTEFRGKRKKKRLEHVLVSEFHHKNPPHRLQYLFPLLVSFRYKPDAMKIMLKNNHSTISVTHQHYQETLFSSIDSIYWVPRTFFPFLTLHFFSL